MTKLSLKEVLVALDSQVIQEQKKNPTLHADNLYELMGGMAGAYVLMGKQLDPSNAWRWGKLKDSASAAQFVDELVRRHELCETTTAFLTLVAFSADLGRLVIQVEHQIGQKHRTQEMHGDASAEVLTKANRLQPVPISGRLWDAGIVAVRHHSKVKNQTLEALGGDKLSLTMCQLLRDVDMTSLWLGKGAKYVTDSAEMARQKVNNKLSDGLSISEYALGCFERGEPIDRLRITTYREFMLQFVAWGFNFTYEETWNMVVASGEPKIILAYIRDSLFSIRDIATWERVEKATRERLNIEI